MAKLKSGTRIYGTATIDTSVVVGSAVTLSSSGIQVAGIVTATTFVGAITGTATSTTNIPNLTGAITSNNTTTSLGSFTSAQLATALTDETGTGANVFATSPVLVTPSLGIATATSIVVSSGSTFTNGPILVGTATSTGTASQPLQVTGGAYVSGSVGIGTTNPTTTLRVQGSSTALDTRIQSVGEKTSIISGNTASLTYNTGGGNIAICTNPSGDITLAVVGIPTDSTFDNTSLTFSVFVNQTGTARSCTAVTLNGLSASIKWPGGSLSAAISGVTTTSGTDIYNFTGINTIGSAGTTANYRVLGVVNGGYR